MPIDCTRFTRALTPQRHFEFAACQPDYRLVDVVHAYRAHSKRTKLVSTACVSLLVAVVPSDGPGLSHRLLGAYVIREYTRALRALHKSEARAFQASSPVRIDNFT